MAGIILYDQEQDWNNFLPLTFTKPISELRIGIMTIREKWTHYLDRETSYKTKEYLACKYACKPEETNLVINSTVLPDEELARTINDLSPGTSLFCGETFIAANVDKKELDIEISGGFSGLKAISYKQSISKINFSWDLFLQNHEQIERDFHILTKGRVSAKISKTNTVIGSDSIFMEEGAVMECAVLNTTSGPIYIGKDAEVMEGSLLRGPLAICGHAVIKMGAKIYSGTTIGPYCKVGGEINNSIFTAYSNKAHDGFIGNAVIGEWCNLGADTNNSNLKNNYENVKVWNYLKKEFIDTGLQFCGLFMGDHSKCSINLMFNTGTTVGVCANIFGSGFPRTFIPSFSWGGASAMTTYEVESALRTAKLVMGRRDISLAAEDESILNEIYRLTSEYKR